MFGSVGIPELLVLLVVLAGFATLLLRRGGLAIAGPVLVLRKFDVNSSGSPAVAIEGRASGFFAWLLTILGVDTLATLTVTDRQVLFKFASWSGESHHLVPTTQVSSTHCRYSQPIWLLLLGGVILLLSMLLALTNRSQNTTQIFVAGLLVAGACGLIYLFRRKVEIAFETTGRRGMRLAFKPSVIEHVSINLQQALRAVNRINAIVAGVSAGSAQVAGMKDERSKHCRKCDASLSPEQMFCTECGAKTD